MYNKEIVLSKILDVFNKQKECAEALEMTEAAFSKALSKPSTKFIAKLKKVGVDIATYTEVGAIKGVNTLIKDREVTYEGAMDKEAKELFAKMQKQLDEQTNEINKWKAVTLDLKIRNEELEKENEQLRVQCSAIAKASSKLQSKMKN